MRPDQVRPPYPRETMLQNAPETEDGFVRVKAVLDADELAR
jgi:Asp-tRNA(Asn)/Glu-tRNA(Gln) amidotransferase C subunit